MGTRSKNLRRWLLVALITLPLLALLAAVIWLGLGARERESESARARIAARGEPLTLEEFAARAAPGDPSPRA